MFKTFGKLLSLLLLLVISFIYTNKVYNEAKNTSPLMKEIIKYKTKNDIKYKDGIISNDELIIGLSGLNINIDESYRNMKDNKKFNKDKIVYDDIHPKLSITNTYDYYIINGNTNKKNTSIIFKINNEEELNEILEFNNLNNIKLNLFIDGNIVENYTSVVAELNEKGYGIYNLGYDNKYSNAKVTITNNLIEGITNEKSLYCLNENKNDTYLKVCKKHKMLSITPSLNNPDIKDIKNNLTNGCIISYDLKTFDLDNLSLIIKVIKSRGYNIVSLEENITEKR